MICRICRCTFECGVRSVCNVFVPCLACVKGHTFTNGISMLHIFINFELCNLCTLDVGNKLFK